MTHSAIVAAFLCLSPAVAQAPDDCRIAIVIGNAAYPTAPLANPGNDASSIADALRKRGFTVFEARDAGKAQMEAAIAEAGAALKDRHGVGMLYYAGHGVQLDLRVYMVPIDAKLKDGADVPAQTVDLQEVVDAFRAAGNRTNILVLDSCRDNPFFGATSKGLAPLDPPAGTFLAYATAPGNVASDGDASSENGLYTQFLVRELAVDGTPIEDVFQRVRYEVRRQSEGRQIPWDGSSLEDDFYFDPKVTSKPTPDRKKEFEIEKADWDRIKESDLPASFYDYLVKYPHGLIGEQAQFRLDQLQRPTLLVQVRDDSVKALASGTNRYAVGDKFIMERVDLLTGISKRSTRLVTSADDKHVVINGGELVWDQMGGVIKSYAGMNDPTSVDAPAEIAVGKRWRNDYVATSPSGSWTNSWDYRVVALEDVEVPAGKFKAYRVERRGFTNWNGSMSPYNQKYHVGMYWIDPRTMLIIKDEDLVRMGGRMDRHERMQLVGYRPGPR